ncbi:GroES-like protein [Coniophora puteana RWD-64-598 SS2]|uniref:GroES-like protein n=1 Tax=Coniophora puteana (strain RWD-64-598) TaxID=741705 RepID=A0A5M3MNQ8_CONPW|nr:GroES-like protein [Coniophora puteana RWD-64-598 SS2]EIW80792.1 GroES-like protein [Coniophora puteana RWD-64-598 SS2]
MAPRTQTALLLPAERGEFQLGSKPVPSPKAGEVLVRNSASALNPIDWKVQTTGFLGPKEYPVVLGFEGAGFVEEVDKGVEGLRKGDRVVSYGEGQTFQQYSIARADIVMKVPDSITFEQAAAVPSAFVTPAIGLYQKSPHGLGFAETWTTSGREKYTGEAILIMGGSTQNGQAAIQLARLSGFSLILTTASAKHSSHLQSLGATHILDRSLSAPQLRVEVEKVTGGKALNVAYDAVGDAATQQAAFDALAPGGQLATVLPSNIAEDKAKAEEKEVVFVIGNIDGDYNQELVSGLMKVLSGLFESGELKTGTPELISGGLGAIPAALKRLQAGGASGVKFVVNPWET